MFGDREQRFMGQGIKSASQICEMKKNKKSDICVLEVLEGRKNNVLQTIFGRSNGPKLPLEGKENSLYIQEVL